MLIKLLSYFPLPLLYFLSDLLSFSAYHIFRYRRKVVIDNLTKCFPEKDQKEIRKLARHFFTNLSDVIVEMIKSFNMNIDDIRKRVKFNNLHVLTDQFEQGRSVICMAGHLGNWEWILYGFNASCNYPAEAVYKPLANKLFNRLMLENRSRFGGNPIAKDDAVREIIKRNKSGVHAFALVADQIPALSAEKYWTTFMGIESAFYVGSDALARLTKGAVTFIGMKRVKRGYYEIDAELLGEPPYGKNKNAMIELYANTLEKYIRENPGDWLWSHKRWKYTREECERVN
jgi:KDO2-lipid IV(A) lauroyltransferase